MAKTVGIEIAAYVIVLFVVWLLAECGRGSWEIVGRNEAVKRLLKIVEK